MGVIWTCPRDQALAPWPTPRSRPIGPRLWRGRLKTTCRLNRVRSPVAPSCDFFDYHNHRLFASFSPLERQAPQRGTLPRVPTPSPRPRDASPLCVIERGRLPGSNSFYFFSLFFSFLQRFSFLHLYAVNTVYAKI